jgi:hypothetical protein
LSATWKTVKPQTSINYLALEWLTNFFFLDPSQAIIAFLRTKLAPSQKLTDKSISAITTSCSTMTVEQFVALTHEEICMIWGTGLHET